MSAKLVLKSLHFSVGTNNKLLEKKKSVKLKKLKSNKKKKSLKAPEDILRKNLNQLLSERERKLKKSNQINYEIMLSHMHRAGRKTTIKRKTSDFDEKDFEFEDETNDATDDTENDELSNNKKPKKKVFTRKK
ncbi:uncharacterized protein LOC136083775 [Hydra vulgaris]|uniref:uncharacterized protein LOC136083775 n=1 Tax=Hydra vulgaris TaxID=6087 RepID=UPI0032EA81CB